MAQTEQPNSSFEFYKMDHPKRGIALIFNHENFQKHKKRNGTSVDCKALEKVLKDLGFAVIVEQDATVEIVEDTILKTASIDHTDHDCLVVIVLSHGSDGQIAAYDDLYETSLLWDNFMSDVCPSLSGKPKLFFIQACRNSSDRLFDVEFLEYDFLAMYSTISGFSSARDPQNGTWFIQALVKILAHHGEKMEIKTLLTEVKKKIALDFKIENPKSNNGELRQLAESQDTLSKNLTFGKASEKKKSNAKIIKQLFK